MLSIPVAVVALWPIVPVASPWRPPSLPSPNFHIILCGPSYPAAVPSPLDRGQALHRLADRGIESNIRVQKKARQQRPRLLTNVGIG